jgi:hypothetical protein
MSIRSALSVVPVWPVLILVPLLTLGFGAAHYAPVYRTCGKLAEARVALTEAAVAAAEASDPVLRLDQAVRVAEWDELRVIPAPKVEGKVLDCPFGWDLSGADRQVLFSTGRMGIVAFARAGTAVDYIEYFRDQVRFEDVEGVVARSAAQFTVARPESGEGPLVLRLPGG